ncbi:YdeI/OmpD-associated family protein [Paenibacillus frigoriresistens]|nr:YdeI/OmpD-associated family protein [Paenibacillus frigoriresistens]
MSYSSRKEYCDWIESAKKAETRSARIEKAVDKLSAGQRLK